MNIIFKKITIALFSIFFITVSSKCQDSTEVIFTDFIVGCQVAGALEPSYVINSEDEYNILLNNLNPFNSSCRNYSLPYIDFGKFTLLGFVTSDGGCTDPQYFKRVVLVDSEKTYVYTIQVITEGLCKRGFGKSNFILIPKIKEGYNVIFKKTLINTEEKIHE